MPTLPNHTFDEIAVELWGIATGARGAVNAAEVLFARGVGGDVTSHTRAELELRATLAGALHRFFRDAARHEGIIRDFIALLDRAEAGEQ